MPEDDGLRRELLAELLTLHARILLRMPIFQLLLIAAIGWIVLPDTPWSLFLAWAGGAFAVECARAAAAWWALPRMRAGVPAGVHNLFLVLDGIAGLAIGVTGILFLPRIPLLSQMILAITLFAVAVAGVSVVVSSKYLLAAYSSMVLLGASAGWSELHRHDAPAVIALTILYWAFLMVVSRDSERLLRRSLAIRRERDDALRALQRSSHEARVAGRRAEQSAQARARVLAAASHDLRQPLHALSVYSAVLLTNPTPEIMREAGQNIDTLVRALGGILGELFDLARLSTGGYHLQHEPFSLDQAVAGVCAEFASIAADKRLDLNCELSAVQLVGDAGAVGRIARNLIDNAIKYTERGHVRVATSRVGTLAVLEVSDSGKGIGEFDRERIFEEFYQIDNPGRDRSKGVGLGLSIVKHLCELMHARIDLDSTSGLGARFTVSFPGASAGSATPSTLQSIQAGLRSWRGSRVYVLDDDLAVRRSMHSLLTLWGFEVFCAASANEVDALFAREGRPDLLIADLRLREAEDGATMTARLAGLHGAFPVLIVTGESDETALRHAEERHHTVLRKPVPFDALYAALDALLRTTPAVLSR